MSRKIIITFMGLALCFNLACDESTEDTSHREETGTAISDNDDSSDGNTEVTLVTYATHIKPIVEEYCVSCHDEEAAENAGLPDSDFTSYAGARPYGSLMPTFELFDDLSTAEQQTINDWIDGGLTEADYLAGVKDVLDTNCISCHPEDAPLRKDMPSSNFYDEEVVKLFGSQFPSFGKLKGVSNDQQLMLERWITDGLQ